MMDVGIICAIEEKEELYDEYDGGCNIYADDFIVVECDVTEPDEGANRMIKAVENYEKAKNKNSDSKINDVLNEREQTHGDFADNAKMAQKLRNVIAESQNYESLSDVQKEAIHNIVSKLSRILCGDADHEDNWIDIAGYSTLVVNELKKEK